MTFSHCFVSGQKIPIRTSSSTICDLIPFQHRTASPTRRTAWTITRGHRWTNVFVAQGARDWPARSSVVVREGDFPDDENTSDHRPVEAVFDPKE